MVIRSLRVGFVGSFTWVRGVLSFTIPCMDVVPYTCDFFWEGYVFMLWLYFMMFELDALSEVAVSLLCVLGWMCDHSHCMCQYNKWVHMIMMKLRLRNEILSCFHECGNHNNMHVTRIWPLQSNHCRFSMVLSLVCGDPLFVVLPITTSTPSCIVRCSKSHMLLVMDLLVAKFVEF